MKPILIFSILVMFFVLTLSSFGQTNWTKYENNPVMNAGSAGSWNDAGYAPGCVLFDGSTYHAWWGGSDDVTFRVGYATSPDGITWTEYAENPVLDVGPSGSWDASGIFRLNVLYQDGTFHMWYTGAWVSGSNEVNGIGYATSKDGINWKKYDDPATEFAPYAESDPVLTRGAMGSWEEDGVLSPYVIFDGEVYHMWYEGANWPKTAIGYATSPDGIVWTKYENNPVMTSTAGNWDYPRVEGPMVYFDGADYHMWYTGAADTWLWRIGYATSPDGITWTKFGDKPVVSNGDPKSWDSQFAAFGTVVVDKVNHFYKMWYGGSRTLSKAIIGYATSPLPLKVPEEYDTIQEAIDAAQDGNVILVDEGTYYENINFKGKAITVASQFFVDGNESHIEKTIIDGSKSTDPDTGAVVSFVSGEDTNSVLQGFTVQGGSGTNIYWDIAGTYRGGGGIVVFKCGARIENNIIKSNHLTATDAYSAAIDISGDKISNYAIIRNNIISDNTISSATNAGGSIGIYTKGTIIFSDNTVSKNSVSANNVAWGGGMLIDGGYSLLGEITICNNIFTENEAHGSNAFGGAVFMRNINPKFYNNIFYKNVADESGGAIHVRRSSNHAWPATLPEFINNTITENSTKYGGGIALRGPSSGSDYCEALVVNTIFWNNHASVNDAEINLFRNSKIDITYSDVSGGYSGEGNISFDPMFVDDLFHLSDESDCIGAGTMQNNVPDTDFDGNMRPNPAGSSPDIGAMENERPFPARDDQLEVPKDYSTIQSAIDAAQDGDKVLVADGTYFENINFKGKAITVASHFIMDEDEDHISNTIIDGSKPSNPDTVSVVSFNSGEDTTSVLCGFTIQGGSGTKSKFEEIVFWAGGGVLFDFSGGKIIHNRITNNTINHPDVYGYAGGVEAFTGEKTGIVIRDNDISYNSVYSDWGGGGGVSLGGSEYILFERNHVHHNLYSSQRHGHGGGLVLLGSDDGYNGKMVLLHNIVTDNTILSEGNFKYGGGIYSESPDLLMVGNIIAKNKGYYGGGFCTLTLNSFDMVSKTIMINNTITENTGVSAGAIWNRGSYLTIINSILWGNHGNREISGMSALSMDFAFSNIQGGWAGGSIMDADPKFVHVELSPGDTLYYCLDAESPCIDSGADSSFCYDYEDKSKPGSALWPAMNTLRNDMGAYGGQNTYDINELPDFIEWATDVQEINAGIPFVYSLNQNYPNPFNPVTQISFSIPKPEQVNLALFNTLGQRVETILDKKISAGSHTLSFNATHLSSGVYFYKITAGDFKQVRKMILIK